MNAAHTTKILKEEDGYFLADLNNGGVRLGLKDVAAFDYPAGHANYTAIRALAEAGSMEEEFDTLFCKHMVTA